MRKVLVDELRKLRGVANYQLGQGVGEVLFGCGLEIVHSPRTKRMKLIYERGKLLATLRPNDGLIALSLRGAERLLRDGRFRNNVTVISDVANFVREGGNVFAKHVKRAGPMIRPEDEVIVVDERGNLLGVGRASLSAEEMLQFRRGVAVRVRRGASTD